MTRPPVEPLADPGQVVEDAELFVPLAVLSAAAVAGVVASGGLQVPVLIFPGAYLDLALVLTDLIPWM